MTIWYSGSDQTDPTPYQGGEPARPTQTPIDYSQQNPPPYVPPVPQATGGADAGNTPLPTGWQKGFENYANYQDQQNLSPDFWQTYSTELPAFYPGFNSPDSAIDPNANAFVNAGNEWRTPYSGFAKGNEAYAAQVQDMAGQLPNWNPNGVPARTTEGRYKTYMNEAMPWTPEAMNNMAQHPFFLQDKPYTEPFAGGYYQPGLMNVHVAPQNQYNPNDYPFVLSHELGHQFYDQSLQDKTFTENQWKLALDQFLNTPHAPNSPEDNLAQQLLTDTHGDPYWERYAILFQKASQGQATIPPSLSPFYSRWYGGK